jgi:hypothetical protein
MIAAGAAGTISKTARIAIDRAVMASIDDTRGQLVGSQDAVRPGIVASDTRGARYNAARKRDMDEASVRASLRDLYEADRKAGEFRSLEGNSPLYPPAETTTPSGSSSRVDSSRNQTSQRRTRPARSALTP